MIKYNDHKELREERSEITVMLSIMARKAWEQNQEAEKEIAFYLHRKIQRQPWVCV